jgi:hypothetical protein
MARCNIQTGLAVLAFTLCAFLLTGCGAASVDGHYPVRGTVTYDGTPLEFGAVVFYETAIGQPGTKTAGVGTAVKNGEYKMDAESGLLPGNYRVEINWQKKTGKQIPLRGDPGNLTEEFVEGLPPEFNKKSKLTATIEAKSNVIDFDLKSGPAKASP